MTRRVLILSNQIPCFPGPGAETRAFCLSKILARSYDITFLLPDYGPSYLAHYEALKTIGDVQVFQAKRQWSRLEWRLTQARTYLEQSGFLKTLSGTPEMVRSVQDLIQPLSERMHQVNWQHFDLFHLIHPHFAGPVENVLIPIPKTLDWVDERTIVLRRQVDASKSPLSNIAKRREIENTECYQKRIISIFDTSFVASDVDADRLEQSTRGKRPVVVPNGVDTDYFVNPNPDRPSGNTLIFTGHMGYQPNEDAVVYFVRHILPIIRAKIPDVRFTVVGMQPSTTVKGLQNEYSEAVEITGEVSDVRLYLANAALSVAPLLSGGGTRLKLLEAMAMRRPVVTTSVGCEGLAIRDDYHAIVRDNAADFASAIIQVLENQALWNRLAGNGHSLVTREYGWEKAAEPILETWECLTATRISSNNHQE